MSATVLPFEIPLGPLNITGFGIAVFLGFAISQVVCQHELARRGHDADANVIPDLVMASVLGTLIGGKLYYTMVITKDWGDLFSRAGFVFWGGFIGAVLANWLFLRWKKLPFLRFADVAGIAIAAGYSVGRTGCWAVGDDYGRPWDGPLSVVFPRGAPPTTAGQLAQYGYPVPAGSAPDSLVAVHPTQLYETALGFLMFLVLWRLRGHKHAEGWLFGCYCVLAGMERFAVEFFRAKDDRFFGALTAAQVIALSIALLGAAIMVARRNVSARSPGIYATAGSGAPAAGG